MNKMDIVDSTEPKVIVTNLKNVMPRKWFSSFLPSITTIVLAVFFIISLLLNGVLPPLAKRGFFCDDSTINYPFKPNTIGLKTLMLFGLIIPLLVIKCCDRFLIKSFNKLANQGKSKAMISRWNRRKVSDDILELDAEEEELIASLPDGRIKRRQLVVNEDSSDYEAVESDISLADNHDNNEFNDLSDNDSEVNLFSSISLDNSDDAAHNNNKQHPFSIATTNLSRRNFGDCQLYLFGYSSTLLFTGIGKITCGRMRPNFMQMCRPNIDCSLKANWNRYIEEFSCTNKDLQPREYSYFTTSFPSGHASMIFFSMLYLIIYLNTTIPILMHFCSDNVKRRFSPLNLHALYVLMMGIAGYISMTRISDYHHHPLDVFCGSVIGVFTAIALSRSIVSRRYLEAIDLIKTNDF